MQRLPMLPRPPRHRTRQPYQARDGLLDQLYQHQLQPLALIRKRLLLLLLQLLLLVVVMVRLQLLVSVLLSSEW